ncbi:LacI family transcriptional regulator [Lactobacillus pasteurii DSM 23907 = CRBIP 24.76]|uniref:LacI family transcriptional regulator n=1 Tax=Lactobacillus pasteurii DSM 23907 = CRBIP 24.76 TaxID=1423790 RepID=I7LA23_9LACO|nr:LacI family DNA-binding transcriptional regulator [Lactobacillus pasteurii]KRK07906.1 LacI family transcriptional regulator [Lactobacillus pasteurii DSM 23907 = CRBIP 24.76]TDG77929.1 hypothetical protein C5L33_001734 [Lactobacillus pasteurii]CCI84326.1 LacI family transcriptional regulator [Lactobacillus pasteurii DSM 23907 = CRBIP 24.76]
MKLTDVAKEAGVSPTTVSRVINNHGYLSEATKTKVFAAMKKLNYQPNTLARSLQGKQTHFIGVIFPTIKNPFFAELVDEIERILFAHGYKIILCNANYDKEKERNYIGMLLANQVDGIIAGAHNLGIEEYEQIGLPIVSFDRKLSQNIPIVSCDNYHGIELACQDLYQNGCRQIYFLGNSHRQGNPTDERLQAYEDTMQKFGLTKHVHSIAFSDSSNLKRIAIDEILNSKKADGIVATDDLTALLVLEEAKKLGLSVPDDLKVIGFDGTNLVQTYHSELSTVAQPISDIAQLLVELLLHRVEKREDITQQHYKLPVKLIHSLTSTQSHPQK